MSDCLDCLDDEHEHLNSRAVDNSAWDGPAAMSNCASSDTPASCYESICAGRKSGDAALQSSWALPHHKRPGAAPNADGVRNSLSRLPQTQGLTNREAAQRHLEAHLAAIQNASSANARPPRDSLVRALRPGPELRAAEDGAGAPTMHGHFAVFNQWTEIDSVFEGRFMESIAPGAFTKTFKENRDVMRVLFQHGRDPMLGSKPLGAISKLEEDDTGAYYEVPLFRGIPELVMEGLTAGLYGASFRFRVTREEFVNKPKASAYNPEGLPERIVKETQVEEFGPVTFPAYAGATAGVRSLTDEFLLERLVSDPKMRELLEHHHVIAPSTPDAAAKPHLGKERREGVVTVQPTFKSDEEWLKWLSNS
jgi:hypothetical protein